MRPTFYLNLQVISYEEDEGTTLLSEKIILKVSEIDQAYEEFNKYYITVGRDQTLTSVPLNGVVGRKVESKPNSP